MPADSLITLILPVALFLIMLGLGLGLDAADFKRVLVYPRVVAIGLGCQLLLLPLLGLLIIYAFSLPPPIAVGLLVIAFSPGGITSNMIAYLARADLPLSITLTALTSLITPITLPLLTGLSISVLMDSAEQPEINLAPTILRLLLVSVLPVVIGMLLKKYCPTQAQRAEKPAKWLSIGFLLAIVMAIVAKNWGQLGLFFALAGPAALGLNLMAMVAGFAIAKYLNLATAPARTIGIEVGMQNGALALLMTGTILASPEMSIPPIVYSLLMTLTCLGFVFITSRLPGHGVEKNPIPARPAQYPSD